MRFDTNFCGTLKEQIAEHHTLYPSTPPQGIFFELLVERTLTLLGRNVISSSVNCPGPDLTADGSPTSIKTETGVNTDPTLINITKLCTTERDPWHPDALKSHVLDHLSRYEQILMLRAVHTSSGFDYQLVQIPTGVLTAVAAVELQQVGRRSGRKSLAADVVLDGLRAFRVYFDGSDGKCQIKNLQIEVCETLDLWHHPKSMNCR